MPSRLLSKHEMEMIDSLSIRFRPIAEAILIRADDRCRDEDVEIMLVYGRRTMQQQLELYSQGRKLVDPRGSALDAKNWIQIGRVITRALPGDSAHNFGEAIDIAIIEGHGQERHWAHDADPRWSTIIGAAATEEGMEWGGRWPRFPDRAHVQHPKWREARGDGS